MANKPTNRGGRPRSDNPRSASIRIKLTPDEKAELEAKAEREGLSVAEMVRLAVGLSS